MKKETTGMCQWCNRRMPLKNHVVIPHFKNGTRKLCAPTKEHHLNLPKTDNKVITGIPRKKWRGPRGFAYPSQNNTMYFSYPV